MAERELRRARRSAQPPRSHSTPALRQAAHPLVAVGAVDAATTTAIQSDLTLAMAVRLPADSGTGQAGQLPRRLTQGEALRQLTRWRRVQPQPWAPSGEPPGLSTRTMPPVTAIAALGARIDLDGCSVYLLSCARTGPGVCFTTVALLSLGEQLGLSQPLEPGVERLTATDDAGTSYRVRFTSHDALKVQLRLQTTDASSAPVTGWLSLIPDPAPGVRWLELHAPGQAGLRVDLSTAGEPARTCAVTPTRLSPGEHLLYCEAANRLAGQLAFFPARRTLAAAKSSVRIGDVVAGLVAAGVLAADSPVPGQLAALYGQLGMTGHSIAAAPVHDLPEPWLSMLDNYDRPASPAPPDGYAGAALTLPALDGVTYTILGLHTSDGGCTLHVHGSGVPPLADGRVLPLIWLRDGAGRWHATRAAGGTQHRGEAIMLLAVTPPLLRAPSVEICVTGRTAQVRATVPLRWA